MMCQLAWKKKSREKKVMESGRGEQSKKMDRELKGRVRGNRQLWLTWLKKKGGNQQQCAKIVVKISRILSTTPLLLLLLLLATIFWLPLDFWWVKVFTSYPAIGLKNVNTRGFKVCSSIIWLRNKDLYGATKQVLGFIHGTALFIFSIEGLLSITILITENFQELWWLLY